MIESGTSRYGYDVDIRSREPAEVQALSRVATALNHLTCHAHAPVEIPPILCELVEPRSNRPVGVSRDGWHRRYAQITLAIAVLATKVWARSATSHRGAINPHPHFLGSPEAAAPLWDTDYVAWDLDSKRQGV